MKNKDELLMAAFKLQDRCQTPNHKIPKHDDRIRRYMQMGASKALVWAAGGGGAAFESSIPFDEMIEDIHCQFSDINIAAEQIGCSPDACDWENQKIKAFQKQIMKGEENDTSRA